MDKLREDITHLLQKLGVVVDRVLTVPLLIAKYVDSGPLGRLVVFPYDSLIGVINVPLIIPDVVIVLIHPVLLLRGRVLVIVGWRWRIYIPPLGLLLNIPIPGSISIVSGWFPGLGSSILWMPIVESIVKFVVNLALRINNNGVIVAIKPIGHSGPTSLHIIVITIDNKTDIATPNLKFIVVASDNCR